ncbi:MAG TPA: glycosyltransferase [Gammaproteobacteria bacterium]|nr:glycosyltransferase [Gammaproteobacteria bacterium]
MNEALLLWINRDWAHPALDALSTWLSSRGGFAFPLLALLLIGFVSRWGKAGARLWLMALLVIGSGDLLGNVLKNAFQHPRPCFELAGQVRLPGQPPGAACGPNLTGMPSNHALNFFAAAMFLSLVLGGRARSLFLVAALVALSRVYLGKHYPAQVLVGGGIGILWGLLWARFGVKYAPLPASARPSQLNWPPMSTTEQTELPHRLSIVVPLYNEQDSVTPLVQRVHECLAHYHHPWELILVSDGSSDGTESEMQAAREKWGRHVRLIYLQRNFGQTAAMQAGIDATRGDVIVTMDGDLQNDPVDIPRLVKRLLEENLDLVSGWRQNRQDNLIRKIPSRLANKLIGQITGVPLHDYGCSLKVFRAPVIKSVRLYGEMHRFIPAWLAANTSPARIKEEVVHHHARQFGQSKYGLGRTFRVLLDLLAVYFFMRFRARPGHFFGRIGLIFGALGGAGLTYLAFVKLALGESIGTRPLLLISVLFVVVSVQFLTTGVLSEMMARTYYESSDTRSYLIRADSASANNGEAAWNEPA